MSNRLIQYGFTAGIVSKTLWSQTVLQKYGYGLADCKNYIIEFSGALISRSGLLADRLLPMAIGKNFRLFPFVFAEEDANTFELLFVANKVYFLQQGAYQLESGKNVTKIVDGVTYTEFTVASHGYAVGDLIEFYGANVPSYLQGQTVVVTTVVNGNTFRVAQINLAKGMDGWAVATATAVSAYRIYSIATPYGETDLPNLYFAQARDVVEITSNDFAPHELERQSDGTWTIAESAVGIVTAAPTGLTGTSDGANDNRQAMFAVSAVSEDGESLPSKKIIIGGISNEVRVTLRWNAVAGATKYSIYQSVNIIGTHLTQAQSLGYIATAFAPNYFVYNIIPDFTKAPRKDQNPFANNSIDYVTVVTGGTGYVVGDTCTFGDSGGTGSGAAGTLIVDDANGNVVGVIIDSIGKNYTTPTLTITTTAGTGATFTIHKKAATGNYPAVSGLHQQRRVFASSDNDPMTLWGSNIGLFNTFTQSDIVADDDSYNYALATPVLGRIYHVVSSRVGLLAFANIGVWQLTGTNDGSITPSDVQADLLSAVGSSTLGPLSIDSDIVYAETNNETIRLFQYNHQSRQYGGLDISVLAKDLFKGEFDLVNWSLQNRPYKNVWATRNDGQLLCCTISQEQEVYAWGRHDTAGIAEDNITVPETEREVTYAVVRRYLSGRWVYVLEHFAARTKSTNENHCGVDCAVQFGGTQPAASLSFDGTTFTASAAVFAAGDVGKVISYRSGKAIIATFNSSTSVDVTVINGFTELEIPYLDVYKDIPFGEWWFIDLIGSVRLPLNFRPASVTIYGDGKLFEDVAVAADGTVTFEEELGFGYIGLGFTCLAVTLPASANGTVIEMSRKNIKGVGLRYVDSKGLEAGTSEDDTYPIEKIQPDIMTEATLLNSAMEEITISSEWDADTQIYIKANGAYPTQVTGIIIDTEVGDDVD